MPAPMMRASNRVTFVRLLADGAAWVVADMSPPVRGGRHLDAGQQGSSTPSDVWPRRLRPAAPARSAGGMIHAKCGRAQGRCTRSAGDRRGHEAVVPGGGLALVL